MTQDKSDGYSEPVLAFDTDEPEFARGFEAGRMWETLRGNDPEGLDGQLFHTTNVEMVLRMLEALGHDGLTAEFTTDDGWMALRYDPSL